MAERKREPKSSAKGCIVCGSSKDIKNICKICVKEELEKQRDFINRLKPMDKKNVFKLMKKSQRG